MANGISLYSTSEIENRIFTMRGVQVMVDRDLAELYQVETKVLNQAVKRNIDRFPTVFRFLLTDAEKDELVTNCDRFKNLKHSSNNPYVFTEQGVAMLSAVLRSTIAVKVSIEIINAFVEMRKLLQHNTVLLQRVQAVENKLILNDAHFNRIFKALESNTVPKQDIFYNGQVYDAYSFIVKLIKQAKKSIVIIDNYVDNTVLDMLTKKNKGVTVTIITQQNTTLKAADINSFNAQYPSITIKYSKAFHDRFLIIDNTLLYHIGASIKDLGKKCFAFSKIEDEAIIKNLISNL